MIKFLDLKMINERFETEISQSINRVLESGWYLLGNEVKSFEEDYRKFIGTKHCIGVANGLDALRLIFKAYIEIGLLKEGDEVIVPANTYIASILAITDNRLVPVLTEPQLNTYNLNPDLIENKISNRTKAILLVHLYGKNAMHSRIENLVKKYNLILIEDNAQACGAYYSSENTLASTSSPHFKLMRTGSIGHAAGHSFYPGKNLGCIGDGGAITTNNDELESVLRALANYGSEKKYVNNFKGFNSRLDEIQAAVLKIKLQYLNEDNFRRHQIAQFYIQNIKNPHVILPYINNDLEVSTINYQFTHVWHLFVIRLRNRDKLQLYLKNKGIETLIHYPIPPHKQLAYKEWNNLSFPITEQIHNEVLSLPLSPVLTDDEVNIIVESLNEYSTTS